MGNKSNIEWTDSTFSPWIGCTKVSPACDHCYAETLMDKRLHVVGWGAGQPRKRTSAKNWKLPLQWNETPFFQCMACGKRGTEAELLKTDESICDCFKHMEPARRRVFCASLADVFDKEVPEQWRYDLWQLIHQTPNLDWLLLTKRIGNAKQPEVYRTLSWPHNVWLGATICNQAEADRDIPKLLAINATVRFLSIEPLLGPVDLTDIPTKNSGHGHHEFSPIITMNVLKRASVFAPHVDWVIVGGESGPEARPMHPAWVTSIRNQCLAAGVPFLFKQWGEWVPRSSCYHTFEDGLSCADMDPGASLWTSIRLTEAGHDGRRLEHSGEGCDAYMQRVGKKMAGRLLDGVTHTDFPKVAK